MMRQVIKPGKRWVVKVGTSTLSSSDGHFSHAQLDQIAAQVVSLLRQKIQVVLVSSGAIALGMETLGLTRRPKLLPELQACAAIGQGKLMKAYETVFSKQGFHTAQILLTRDEFENRSRYLNAKNTMASLLKMNILPIVNENDTIATEEIKFGDNDMLAAQVANLAAADLIVFLSDIDGFYLNDRTLIRKIESPAQLKEYARHIQPKKSEKTAGGMKTKFEAAEVAMRSGIPIVLANGRDEHVMERILQGEEVGSLFFPSAQKSSARKKWLAHSAQAKGVITVDRGAYRALVESKKSLLAGGVIGSNGSFRAGDLVEIQDDAGGVFARGLVNYSSEELAQIQGRKSAEIRLILGMRRREELIHRNNLVLLG